MNEYGHLYWKAPGACSAEECKAFFALVSKEQQISADYLTAGMEQAKRLVFLLHYGRIIGAAALKNPKSTYLPNISKKADVELDPKQLPFELGYIAVDPDFRRKGLSRPLVCCALDGIDAGVFATSRSDNDAMHKTLCRVGFKVLGKDYPSENGEHQLKLFARPTPWSAQ